MLPSAFRVPPEPVVTPAKAGARTRRLIFCRAAERSPSQGCAQAVRATVALVGCSEGSGADDRAPLIERDVAPEGGDVESENAPARACTVCARALCESEHVHCVRVYDKTASMSFFGAASLT